jgi:hypothetical protein
VVLPGPRVLLGRKRGCPCRLSRLAGSPGLGLSDVKTAPQQKCAASHGGPLVATFFPWGPTLGPWTPQRERPPPPGLVSFSGTLGWAVGMFFQWGLWRAVPRLQLCPAVN